MGFMQQQCRPLSSPFSHFFSLLQTTTKITNSWPLFVFHHLNHFQPNPNSNSSLSSSSSSFSSSSCQLEFPRNELASGFVHATAIKDGSTQHLHVSNYILSLYAKSADLVDARKLFDESPETDVGSWTILISGFSRVGFYKESLNIFTQMQKRGIFPNCFTLSSVLKCCSSINELRMGKGVHGWILRNGIYIDIALENSLLDFYVKCREFHCARRLFELMVSKDTVSWNIMMGAYLQIGDMENSLIMFHRFPEKDAASWNTIIDGHLQNGCEKIAMELLHQMVKTGPAFTEVTFSIALVLASYLNTLELGEQIHSRILRIGLQDDGFIKNSLIDMYCKCGQMEKAMLIFQDFTHASARMRNSKHCYSLSLSGSVSVSSMVSGYIQNGMFEDALKFFIFMVREGYQVEKFTLTSMVSACAEAGLLELGQLIHAYVLKTGQEVDVFLSSSMINMYAKCGRLYDGWSIFRQAKTRNVVLWTALISCYALHGQGKEAICLFELMQKEGIVPNEVTFVGVLTACSHAGLFDEGFKYFTLMKDAYAIKPQVEHYTCMVDLFGRAGRLNEIKDFIYKNNISHLPAVWKAFLSSCRVHKCVEMATWVSDKLFELEPLATGSYVLLSNTYASGYKWDDAATLRGMMEERGLKKQPGQSWTQMRDKVHTFVMGDRSHPEVGKIYSYLDKLLGRLKEIGYSSDLNPVLQDVEEEQKELILGVHSEKLALAYALISSVDGTPVRIMKNLRVCTDCHTFIKYTSYLLNREIIVRDIRRFHHFRQGYCSCGDYW